MAYYDYQCQDCKETVEVKASISEKENGLDVACPKCDSHNTVQVFKSMAVIGANTAGGSSWSAPESSGGPGPCGSGCGCAFGN